MLLLAVDYCNLGNTLTTMVISGDDYKIEGEGIWLSKKLLEEYKAHYLNVAEGNRDSWKKNKDTFKFPFYEGKAEVLYDILKMFDELEG